MGFSLTYLYFFPFIKLIMTFPWLIIFLHLQTDNNLTLTVNCLPKVRYHDNDFPSWQSVIYFTDLCLCDWYSTGIDDFFPRSTDTGHGTRDTGLGTWDTPRFPVHYNSEADFKHGQASQRRTTISSSCLFFIHSLTVIISFVDNVPPFHLVPVMKLARILFMFDYLGLFPFSLYLPDTDKFS